MQYRGEEIRHIFQLDHNLTLVLASRDDGHSWLMGLSRNGERECPFMQNFSEALKHAGLAVCLTKDLESLTSALSPAVRFLTHVLGKTDGFEQVCEPLLAAYRKLMGTSFPG